MRDIVVTSSVLITAIFIIRCLVKGRIHPVLQYALWLPVALRLVIPVPLWESWFSVLNYLPDNRVRQEAAVQEEVMYQSGAPENLTDGLTDNPSKAAAYNAANIENQLPSQTQNRQKDSNGGLQNDSGIQSGILFLPGILRILWIAGMVLLGGYMLFYQMKWKRYLRRNRKPLKGMKEYHGLSVYTVRGLPSPCLSGRCIYLTKEMAADEKRLQHILVHEYCHYRHGDSFWVIVRCVLMVVYWFHPLVWAAAYASKQDSELACDAACIHLLGEEERIAYGKTLLRLIAGEEEGRNRMGFASTMSGGEKGIRERISRLARKRNYAAAAAGGVVLLAAAIVVITFSGNKQDMAQIEEDAGQSEQLEELQKEADVQASALEKELEAEILKRLSAYDERIVPLGSQENVYGISDAKNQSDFVQAYYENGEDALEEGIYQLEKVKGEDGADITIYGMYTEKYGCRGIKILIGNDGNDFDEPWQIDGMQGQEENIRVYEYAQDGMPRTFACKMIAENTSTAEIWDLYLCDRYDTGTSDLYQFAAQDYMGQINNRLRLEIESSENKMPVIAVYDKENKVGEIEVPVSEEAAGEIKDAIINASAVTFELGTQENELKLLIAVGIRFDKINEIWYDKLPIISFPITCGSMGEREFHLGEASIESELIAQTLQSKDSIDELCGLPLADSIDKARDTENAILQAFNTEEGHHDVAVVYTNPCPSYTRISDTFGERTHPYTQEKRMHNGIDLAAEAGADVVAAADGIVYQTGFDAENGNYVVLYHEMNGEYTYYTACQDILAVEGESVTAGERIATVGSTGRSSGAHLHFAVSRNGEYIEPVFEENVE